MRKIIFNIFIFFISLIGAYVIYWRLPITVNRRSEINLGNKIIKNIETYKKLNGLPDDQREETLPKFGFEDRGTFLQPLYRKIDTQNFELIFIEGFDGPYLMWNSKDRKWKEGFPIIVK